MCLLLFREPYFSTPELDSTLVWMKVHHSVGHCPSFERCWVGSVVLAVACDALHTPCLNCGRLSFAWRVKQVCTCTAHSM
jgi:hypothetical protein